MVDEGCCVGLSCGYIVCYFVFFVLDFVVVDFWCKDLGEDVLGNFDFEGCVN